jgi:hypothetical protein
MIEVRCRPTIELDARGAGRQEASNRWKVVGGFLDRIL